MKQTFDGGFQPFRTRTGASLRSPPSSYRSVSRTATLALACDLAACDQLSDRDVPLTVRDAGGAEDVSLGVPAVVRAQKAKNFNSGIRALDGGSPCLEIKRRLLGPICVG